MDSRLGAMVFAVIGVGWVGCGGRSIQPDSGPPTDGGLSDRARDVENALDAWDPADACSAHCGSTLAEQMIPVSQACVFVLPCPYSPPGDMGMDVIIDVTVVRRDPGHVDGWDYVNPGFTLVQLYGPACAAALAGTAGTVAVIQRCGI